MKEGLLFLLTLLAVTYLCWRIFKADRAQAGKRPSLGVFTHKDDAQS